MRIPKRREFYNTFLRNTSKEGMGWRFVDLCWAGVYRELQYLDVGYLDVMKGKLASSDISKLKDFN
jgi:hypothetical protein